MKPNHLLAALCLALTLPFAAHASTEAKCEAAVDNLYKVMKAPPADPQAQKMRAADKKSCLDKWADSKDECVSGIKKMSEYTACK